MRNPRTEAARGFQDRLPSAAEVEAAIGPGASTVVVKRPPLLKSYAEVSAKATRWLWPGRFPLGELGLLVGSPDCGKTCVAMDMAAMVSTGRAWPDEEQARPARGVLLAIAEDSHERTVRPRLDAAGADVRRVHPIEDDFNVAQVDRLEGWILDHDAALVVLDPVMSMLPLGLNKDDEVAVRAVLEPLKGVAERTQASIIMIVHTKKAGADMPLHKVLGSQAWGAVPRAAWGVAKLREDPSKRVLTKLKMNLAEDPGSLRFQLSRVEVMIEGEHKTMPRVDWGEVDRDLHAEDVFEERGGRGAGYAPIKLEEASAFLVELLAGGPRLSEEVFKAGKARGISKDTLYRSKEEMGIKAIQVNRRWHWRMPQTGTDAREGECLSEPKWPQVG